MAAEVRVLFIGGSGRSGSTLLERMLGNVPGVCSVGEVWALWKRDVQARELCGCGEPVPACPFWQEVLSRAFPGHAPEQGRAFARNQQALLKRRRGPALRWARFLPDDLRSPFERFAAERRALFAAIAQVSGAKLIVDSSKVPRYGAALAGVSGLDVRALHLVRDPRAIAYSWSTNKENRKADGHFEIMPRYPVALTAARAMTRALQMEGRWLGTRRSLTVNYEAFAAAPARSTRRILAFAGMPGATLPARGAEPESFQLQPTHSILGNPMRHDRGDVAIRRDDRWRTAMDPADRRTVTRRTWPLLLRYGYIGPFRHAWAGHTGGEK